MMTFRQPGLVVFCAVFAAGLSMGDGGTNALPRAVRRPIVVMKQSEIRGQVFFLPDGEETKENQTAATQKIQIRKADGSDIIYATATDNKGEYAIPNLDLGAYQLRVGRLILQLQVEDPSGNEQRKNIVVFIPRSLAEKGK